jgi:hypothetical protein
MVAIMSGIAQFGATDPRPLRGGHPKAKAKGITFGRKRKLDAEMTRVAAERYGKGETWRSLPPPSVSSRRCGGAAVAAPDLTP